MDLTGPRVTADALWVLGVGGTVLGLLGLLLNRRPEERPGPWAGPVGAALLAGGGVASLLVGWPRGLGAGLLVLAAAWGLFCAARSGPVRRAAAVVGRAAADPRWQWLALLLAGPPLALLAAGREDLAPALPDCTELPRGRVVTDRGHPVRLTVPTGPPAALAALRATEAAWLRREGFAGRVLGTAPTDPGYNCHGWVFAAGRYLIADAEVDAILRDNGYAPVAEPRAGDLIVHRDDAGRVCHTGVVRVADPSGAVIIESKWAWMGRYLHRPEAQPYGPHWAYYRSDRPGHTLRGLAAPDPSFPFPADPDLAPVPSASEPDPAGQTRG
jgi:hypothetical protein